MLKEAQPFILGRVEVDESTGTHCGLRNWAITRAHLTAGSLEGLRGRSYVYASTGFDGDGMLQFPHSEKYARSFFVVQGVGKIPQEVQEKDLHIEFEIHSEGG